MPLLYEILGSTYKKNDVNDHKSEAMRRKGQKESSIKQHGVLIISLKLFISVYIDGGKQTKKL